MTVNQSRDQTVGQSTTLVIFGASGDLTRRKLIPALCSLFCKGRLGPEVNIVGVSRSVLTSEEFRNSLFEEHRESDEFQPTAAEWQEFAQRVHYCCGDVLSAQDLKGLEATLSGVEAPGQPANRLYYMALSPSLFEPAVLNLGENGFAAEDGCWRRVVVEKPFGFDLPSAQKLNQTIHSTFRENQVYRIDHYLAKETVQNLLVFRFANTIFEPVWSRNYIDNVQITVSETVSVSERAGYYDQSGVLRDMFQNHLLQLLTVTAMEPPSSFAADALRNEKIKVLEAIRPISPDAVSENAVYAQYEGYLGEDGVAPGSRTPTYAALRLDVDNWRWQGVPFYLRSGKALKNKRTEVIVQFRRPPHLLFPQGESGEIASNILSVCLQPDEGVHLEFQAKTPDASLSLRPVDLEFHYEDSFGGQEIPDSYERLLLDALSGDASLFIRSDEIEQAWRVIDPVIQGLALPGSPPPASYPVNSEGPDAAVEFLAKDGREWLQRCGGH